MRTSTVIALFGVVGGWTMLETTVHGQPPAAVARAQAASKTQLALDKNAEENTFTFIVFYKEDSSATREMIRIAHENTANRAECSVVVTANANDPAERALIERFGIGRAPMPLAVAVAPNGAITGVFPKALNAQHIEASIVTPTMARCMKSLQSQKLVFVVASRDDKPEVPVGVRALQKDPLFKDRIVLTGLRLDDPAETRFLSQMKIDPARVNGPYAVLIAPPGVLVGHFDATATGDTIAAAIHKSGQCCDDPNCKHTGKAAQQATQPAKSRKN